MILLWVPRLIAAGIMLMVSYLKFLGNPGDAALFAQLGMEPHGRILVGIIELVAGLLLLSPYAASGALLTVSVMLGALIAHATFLGIVVDGDGGKHVMMLALVLISSAIVLIVRRRELPIVGKTL